MNDTKTEDERLMNRMYRLFSIRSRSEKEIWDYFKRLSFKRKIKGKKELSLTKCTTIVEQLKQKGLINDEEFAKAWVESRSRKYGVNRIKQELFQKGIDRETVEEVTRVNLSTHSMSSGFIPGVHPEGQAGSGQRSLESRGEEIAEKQLEKKMKVWKNLPEMELKKKAYEYLLRRGFEYSLVKETIAKFLNKL